MSKDITEKQHYVWRKYLEAWKSNPDDKVQWVGFLKTKEAKKVSLRDVAHQSFFYKLEELTDEELNFLKLYNNNFSSNVRQISDIVLAGYILFTQLKRDIASGKITPNGNYEHEVKKIEATSFESIQSQIESLGIELLSCTTINDFEKLAATKEYEILYFLMVQYMRTKTMKDRIVNSMTERVNLQEIARKCWPYYNLVTAMQMVESFYKRQDCHFVFIQNKSSLPFITGDQPIINAKGNELDENGLVKELELYYPLSPTTAFVVDFTDGDKFSERVVDENYVKGRNTLIVKESELHVFANQEDVLKGLL